MPRLPRPRISATMILAIYLIACPMIARSESPKSSEPPLIPLLNERANAEMTLTEAELEAIVTDAVDEAVILAIQEAIATERPERQRAEKERDAALARSKNAAPWIISGVSVLACLAFLGGFLAGSR